MSRKEWISVDMDGLKALLARRGKEFALFELISNAWDENTGHVHVVLTRPEHGVSRLTVQDDSPQGFQDLTDAFTMFKSSKKKVDPEKRGVFNCGEKFVLALCEEARIKSTTGSVVFDDNGRRFYGHLKTAAGTIFSGKLRLTLAEFEQMCDATAKLLPPVRTYFNGVLLPMRAAQKTWTATLATVKADEEGNLRPTQRQTTVETYSVVPGQTAMLYEMGVPVVEIQSKYHVNVGQKVPLNIDRDNVTPAYLRTIQVEVLNNMIEDLGADDASAVWVRSAASDSRVADDAVRKVLDLRFGDRRVSFDPNDQGSNREAASQDWTVITGGSLTAGEWENARRAGAIVSAGQMFPTSHGSKVPDKIYSPDEWTQQMRFYSEFVMKASPLLVGHTVSVRFIKDPKMVCGQFFGNYFNANLAKLNVDNWQANIDLMLHELAHTVVQSNDHLCHEFYDTVTKLGAKLALALAKHPDLREYLPTA